MILNRLQRLEAARDYCVTLNPQAPVAAGHVLRTMDYTHPLYTRAAVRAQARWAEISGVARTHFCGAYWFYGFHEDGLRSGVRVAESPRSALVDGTGPVRRAACGIGGSGPGRTSFTYNLFMVLVDVDHVDDADARSRFTSVNRFNWATFDDRDHLGDAARPLRERWRRTRPAAGLRPARRPDVSADPPALSRLQLQSDLVLLLLRPRPAKSGW